MDNLAHALVGAALGRAVADRHVPRASLIGAIAANMPDLAETFSGYWGWSRSQFLVHHRGITHSLIGALIQIPVLILTIGLITRARTQWRAPWRWLTLCVGITFASHLFMDWQGSYGWRPFLPWSNRWFYLDWVAIVDPFFWLVPLVALAWGSERHWTPLSGVLVIGGFIGVLLVGRHDIVAPWVLWVLSSTASSRLWGGFATGSVRWLGSVPLRSRSYSLCCIAARTQSWQRRASGRSGSWPNTASAPARPGRR